MAPTTVTAARAARRDRAERRADGGTLPRASFRVPGRPGTGWPGTRNGMRRACFRGTVCRCCVCDSHARVPRMVAGGSRAGPAQDLPAESCVGHGSAIRGARTARFGGHIVRPTQPCFSRGCAYSRVSTLFHPGCGEIRDRHAWWARRGRSMLSRIEPTCFRAAAGGGATTRHRCSRRWRTLRRAAEPTSEARRSGQRCSCARVGAQGDGRLRPPRGGKGLSA
jgi:hypothetical protein